MTTQPKNTPNSIDIEYGFDLKKFPPMMELRFFMMIAGGFADGRNGCWHFCARPSRKVMENAAQKHYVNWVM
jgi:hypothetical protein